MNYKLIMDSSGDLKSMEGEAYASVPLKIQAGDRSYVDDAHVDVADMVQFLRSYKGKSASACPSIGEYLEAFGDAEYVYCVTITSNLSGSYNAAKAAADTYMEQYPERKVHVFDSLSAGPEMTLLLLKLQELVHAGNDHETVVHEANEYLSRTRLAFSLESLHNLAVNGRVPAVVAKATGILGIRLIGKASDVGTLQPVGKARGEAKVVPELFKHMSESGYNGGKVRIHHCFNTPAAEKLRNTILEAFPNANVVIDIAHALCSFYAEQGGMLIGYET